MPCPDQVARAGAHRRPLIHERQHSRLGIDRKCAHRAGRLALELVELVHGEKQAAPEIELEERRVRRLGGQSERNQRDVLRDLEVLGLEPEKVNPLLFDPVYVPT